MAALENQKHELFARKVAEGMDATAAYQKVYKKSTKASALTAGPRLLGNVRNRVKEIQSSNLSEEIMDKNERLKFLSRAIETSIKDVDESSTLCQSYEKDKNGKVKYRMVDKLKALELISRLCGDFTIVDGGNSVNVNVNVAIISEEARQSLIQRKRDATLRRLAQKN